MNSPQQKISIIIPVINEASTIQKCLLQFQNKQNQEVIIVDGGSADNTIELVKKQGFKVVQSEVKKRSYQMNLGAKEAQGDILLFLHSDTILPNNYLSSIHNILAKQNTIAGAFRLQIDDGKQSFRFLETMVNLRSHLCSLPYGDQGIFIQKSIFKQIGGFPDFPIMEDFALIKILQKKGKIRIADDAVITSARRWQKLGLWKTTIINQWVIIGYYLGIDLNTLANFYRHQK
jgi:rSAM/selenodomain-associated transferase 2